jgi:hypothetical protein
MQTSIQELSRRDRHRQIALTAVRTTAVVVLLLALYAFAPVSFVSGADMFVRLGLVLVIVTVVIVAQVHSIRTATYPELRAIQSLVTAIAVFLVLFALLYLSLSTAYPASFNRPLTRVSAFYFTVTVLATVGFGDITAQNDLAQVIVTVQMLLDLVLIAVIVRVFAAAARSGASRRQAARDPNSP